MMLDPQARTPSTFSSLWAPVPALSRNTSQKWETRLAQGTCRWFEFKLFKLFKLSFSYHYFRIAFVSWNFAAARPRTVAASMSISTGGEDQEGLVHQSGRWEMKDIMNEQSAKMQKILGAGSNPGSTCHSKCQLDPTIQTQSKSHSLTWLFLCLSA